jgi:hypothetical protein
LTLKRLLVLIFALVMTAQLAGAEEANPPVSFGMQLGIDYNVLTGSFSLWNLRYGLGIDFLIHLGSGFSIGPELGAYFGFSKANLTDSSFNQISVAFPLHLTALVFLGGFTIQLYGGATYSGGAAVSGGVVYASNFSFQLLPDIGLKVGWGNINNLFLKGGYVFGDNAFVYFGVGARIGLF